jgi:hypothetical protein
MRFADAWLHVARKTKRYDDWDPPYEPVWSGRCGDEAIDD